MTQRSYFGTQNSILGSIVPLVMFTYILFHIFLFRPPLYILRCHIIVVHNWWSARLIRERQSLWPFCVRASGPICPTLPPPPARHYGKQFIKKVFLFNLFGQCWPPLPPLQLHITSTNHCLYHGANILTDNEILINDNDICCPLVFSIRQNMRSLSSPPPPPPSKIVFSKILKDSLQKGFLFLLLFVVRYEQENVTSWKCSWPKKIAHNNNHHHHHGYHQMQVDRHASKRESPSPQTLDSCLLLDNMGCKNVFFWGQFLDALASLKTMLDIQ